MSQNLLIFDRLRQKLLKSRVPSPHTQPDLYFFHQEIESLLVERLDFVQQSFPRVLFPGSTSIDFMSQLQKQGQGRDLCVVLDSDPRTLPFLESPKFSIQKIVADEEVIPFETNSFDLIVSCLHLHNINLVPEVLFKSRHILRPGGLYLAAFVGGETLYELRASLLQAEVEMTGGAGARIHPMIDLMSALQLFNQANFKSPVVDRQYFTLNYSSLSSLLKEIKTIGESNSLNERSPLPLHRSILQRAEEIYRDNFANSEGLLQVSVEVIFFTGWA